MKKIYSLSKLLFAILLFSHEVSGQGYTAGWRILENVSVAPDGTIGYAGPNYAMVVSSNTISVGHDGWLQFTIADASSSYSIGFSANDLASINAMSYSVNVGQVNGVNKLSIFESSWASIDGGDWQVGDVIKIELSQGSVNYYRNSQPIRTTAVIAPLDFQVKAFINYVWGFNSSIPIIHVSEQKVIGVNSSFVAVSSGSDGSVKVIGNGGRPPYTYHWSDGSSIDSIVNKSKGTYTVTVSDADGLSMSRTFDLERAVQWKTLKNIAFNNGVLTWQNFDGLAAGIAISSNVIPANQDGWVAFIITDPLGQCTIALESQADEYLGLLDYSIKIGFNDGENRLSIYEKSWTPSLVGTWQVGDFIKISREGNQIKYYQNGNLLKSTTTDNSKLLKVSGELAMAYINTMPVVVTSANSTDNQIVPVGYVSGTDTDGNNGTVNLKMINGIPPYSYQWKTGETTNSISSKTPGTYTVTVKDFYGRTATENFLMGPEIHWQDLSGTVLTNSKLTRTDPNIGTAVSSDFIAPNQDGWIEFVVTDRLARFAIGLSNQTTSAGYHIDYGFSLDWQPDVNNPLLISEASNINAGSWRAGDILLIGRKADQIMYYQNGTLLRSAKIDPATTLKVCTSMGLYTGQLLPAVILDAEQTTSNSALCANIFCSDDGVGIGTKNIPSGYFLAVNGKVISEGVKVMLQSKWPDFVFEKEYKLPKLHEVESYIRANGHLPETPSAKEVGENGLDLGAMNSKLLQKIEELTLYLIELTKKNEAMESTMNDLKKEITLLKSEPKK